MLDNIIKYSIQNKIVIGLMTLLLIIWGIWSATKLPIDALPDITDNQVQILTRCPTLSAQEVELYVTSPIEKAISNLPDIVEKRSFSRFGLSAITVVFKDEVNVYFARQLINEKLKEVEKDIPESMGRPELAPVTTGLGEIYQYVIRPKKGSENKYTAMDLRTIQDWIVSRQLSGIKGVAEITGFGGITKQYEVAVNPDKLKAMDVSIPELFAALEKNNANTGGAYIDKKPNAYFIRAIGVVKTFEDIENIVIKNQNNGIPIRIGDVAKVQFGSPPRYGALTYNGEEEVTGGVVMMLKGANSSDVIQLVKERITTIQKSLPADVVIEPYLDRTDLVNRAIFTVEKNLIEGALIVIFVLVLFLGNFRAGLIVASAIPLALLFALALMNLFGVSANLMSLGAIDFGLIVDGSVIIVEATLHHLGLRKIIQKLSQQEMDDEVYLSASKTRTSAAFGEIIILIVYIPILTLVGIEGKMFSPMAMTVGFAILGSLILSLTYIPMMCALFLPKTISDKKNFSDKMMGTFQKIYQPLLQKAIQLKYVLTASTLAIFAFSLFVFSTMGSEFIPTLEEGDYAIEFLLPQGASLSQTTETVLKAEKIIKQFPEVKMVVGKTGAADVATDPMPMQATDIMVILKNRDEWTTTDDFYTLADLMKEKLEVLPGVIAEPSQPIQMRFNELMTGIKQDVAIKIFGENLDTLALYATKVGKSIQGVNGISQPQTEQIDGLPQISIEYDRNKMALYGLNIVDVNHIITTAFAGEKVGVVFENERKFDLTVRLDSAYRSSLADISNLFVPTKSGNQIPLSQIATISYKQGPAQISREDGKRRVYVSFNVKDRDVASVVAEIKTKLDAEVKLPAGYYFTYGGTFENLQKASQRLMIAVPISLLLIFLLLYFTFKSFGQAALIFTAIPMSAIGGVFALLIRDMPFSISAGIGFIALFGVAVLNGIVLIGTFNQLEKEGMSDVFRRVIEGTKIRLRPVLMTALVASLGFLPMALSNSAGAEVQKPLATVVIGGLFSATFLTLFVLPLLYIIFSEKKFRKIPVSKLAIVLVLVGFSTKILRAQNPIQSISLTQAIELAQKNNLHVQSQQLYVQSTVAIQKSVFELPKTDLNFQYGQYNSIQKDNGFRIAQNIPFPTYFKAKAAFYTATKVSKELQLQLTQAEVKAKVESAFYQIMYLQNVRKQLLALDTLYAEMIKASALRYKSGETNLLEKTTAETKKGQHATLLLQNEMEIAMEYSTLKSLLNSSDDFEIEKQVDYNPINLNLVLDTSKIKENASVKLLYQEALITEQSKKTETAAALPSFNLGYLNQSIKGYQNVNGSDILFNGSKRFQGIDLGVSMPLAFWSNTAKIKSLSLQHEAQNKAAENSKMNLESQYQNAFLEYNKNIFQYNYYKNTANANAIALVAAAKTGFRTGNIGYIEYLQALETAKDVQLHYSETINQINQSLVAIQYLINN